jgi:hypothetical protein
LVLEEGFFLFFNSSGRVIMCLDSWSMVITGLDFCERVITCLDF